MASGQVVGEVSLDCRLREVAMLLSDDIQLERQAITGNSR